MNYIELNDIEDIAPAINELRALHKGLSGIVQAGEYESTMGKKKILTLFYKFEPVVKVEGKEELLHRFSLKLKEEMGSTALG